MALSWIHWISRMLVIGLFVGTFCGIMQVMAEPRSAGCWGSVSRCWLKMMDLLWSVNGYTVLLCCTGPLCFAAYQSCLLVKRNIHRIREIGRRILGERMMDSIGRLWNWILYEKNPLLLWTYALLHGISFLLFIFNIFPYFAEEKYGLNPNIHCPLAVFLMISTFAAWWNACTSDPGVITAENHSFYSRLAKLSPIFPYDDVECQTCHFMKIPRSKHCSMCNHCVFKFDHHCPWISACVGVNNHRHFCTFLLVNWLMFLYGFYSLQRIVFTILRETQIMRRVFVNRVTGEEFKATYWLAFQWMITNHQTATGLLVVCIVIGSVLFAFWFYHLFYLGGSNMTTNESAKYSQLRRFMKWRNKKKAEAEAKKAKPDLDSVAPHKRQELMNQQSTGNSQSDAKSVADPSVSSPPSTVTTTNPANQPSSSSDESGSSPVQSPSSDSSTQSSSESSSEDKSDVDHSKEQSKNEHKQGECEEKKQREDKPKEGTKRYIYKDYPLSEWNKVNYYDKGFFNNLYSVYFPFAELEKNLEDTSESWSESNDHQSSSSQGESSLKNSNQTKPSKKKSKDATHLEKAFKSQKIRKRRKIR